MQLGQYLGSKHKGVKVLGEVMEAISQLYRSTLTDRRALSFICRFLYEIARKR
jgi:hypothetical protein